MELAEYLGKKLKHAAKSVLYNRSQYVCFFIAMFVVEIFCGLAVVAAHNGTKLERKFITEEFDCHLELRNMNDDQFYYMANDEYTVFSNQHIYDNVKTETRRDAVTGENLYTMHIKFTGNPKECYKAFAKRYFGELNSLADSGGRYNTFITPLYNIEIRLTRNAVLGVFGFLLVTALSVALVTALYNIRINHYRFEYGIYMTFGADFRRLMSVCVWEMLVVAAVVYVPAVIASWLISLAVYKASGLSYSYNAAAPLLVLLFSLLVSVLSVCVPVWRLSRRTPRSNILAEDNSNLVVSPRLSFEMLTKTYPRGYEMISFWRFRKYSLRLFAVAAAFTALFTAMVYAAGLINIKENYQQAQFYIELYPGGYRYDDYMGEELLGIPGVTEIIKWDATSALYMKSHIAVENRNVPLLSTFPMTEDEKRATNLAVYIGADEETLGYLSDYDITGDPRSIFENERTVIVTDSTNLSRKLKIKPGDKIWVGLYMDKIVDTPPNLSEHDLLREQLRVYKFTYAEFTVGAVIHDFPSSKEISVFFADDDYKSIVGHPISYGALQLNVDQSLTLDDIKKTEDALAGWSDYYPGVKITNTRALSEKQITLAKNLPAFIICIAALLLATIPLMWFFSQVLFSLKREGEFNVLLALGAIVDEVRRQLICDGLLSAACSLVMLLAMMSVSSCAVCFAGNAITVFTMKTPVRFIFHMPWIPAAVGLVLGFACAFLSCYIPFILYKRRVDIISVTDPAEI